MEKQCMNELEKYGFQGIWINPSASSGKFFTYIEDCIAYDIKPNHKRILKEDFLTSELPAGCIVFGYLTKQYIRKASTKANVIGCLVLKENRYYLPHGFQCIKQLEFPRHVFQLWKRRSNPPIQQYRFVKGEPFHIAFCFKGLQKGICSYVGHPSTHYFIQLKNPLVGPYIIEQSYKWKYYGDSISKGQASEFFHSTC